MTAITPTPPPTMDIQKWLDERRERVSTTRRARPHRHPKEITASGGRVKLHTFASSEASGDRNG